MEKRTSWVAVAAILLTAGGAAAQPSDAQVKKDMSGPTVLQVRLTSKPGTVQANTDTLNYEFVRGVEIVEKTDMPGVKLLVIGDAVYQRVSDPGVDTRQSQGTRMYLVAAVNKLNTMMAAERTGGAYKDGVKVGEQWKLSELQVRVREDDDAIQFVSSFSDRNKLCPRDVAR